MKPKLTPKQREQHKKLLKSAEGRVEDIKKQVAQKGGKNG